MFLEMRQDLTVEIRNDSAQNADPPPRRCTTQSAAYANNDR
jgi:hypothetical protein